MTRSFQVEIEAAPRGYVVRQGGAVVAALSELDHLHDWLEEHLRPLEPRPQPDVDQSLPRVVASIEADPTVEDAKPRRKMFRSLRGGKG